MTALTQRQYDEIELRNMERRLTDISDSGRQVSPTPKGQAYRERLRRDIAELRERLTRDAEA